ncbi:DUF2726 domain-containing protein [Phenylobacterium sp. J426]|uniref:DUF2726 domain-containing protein n=1 Tax=Phenylobacterium sp. J426 TaxID=2898439 RepID=UPI0021518BE7|nr:DUF2726 domain-containing protein [Phenylobacterium sp. J426]MCR5873579.1 DUF2726 domain-containing protein [Phenylobacterium sp. J426]
MILNGSDMIVVAAASAAGLIGMYIERGRVAAARAARRGSLAPDRRRGRVAPFRKDGRPLARPLDASEQLRLVMDADFEARPLMNRGEARVFEAAERAIAERRLAWRVMAQVSLGEILSASDEAAFRAINSKRVDVLIVTREGRPLAALEHQGAGHYVGGTAPARDAVKKEALRKAGVRYVELTPEHGPEDVAREIERLAGGVRAEAARVGARKPRSVLS